MANYFDLIDSLPLKDFADKLGFDEGVIADAAGKLVPVLMGGMRENAKDSAGAESLAKALNDHDPQLVEGGVDLSKIDVDDGGKIVQHVFGDKTDDVMAQFGGLLGGANIAKRLLPMLAPLVMSWLAGRMKAPAPAPQAQPKRDGGLLGSIVDAVTGGGRKAPAPAPAPAPRGGGNPDLTEILGDLLGGSQGTQQSGGGLGDLLDTFGGLLGGGRR